MSSVGVCSLVYAEPAFDGCVVVSGNYHTWRCRSGVGEGIVDFPPGQSFPLEANLDFMNGGIKYNVLYCRMSFLLYCFCICLGGVAIIHLHAAYLCLVPLI